MSIIYGIMQLINITSAEYDMLRSFYSKLECIYLLLFIIIY